MVDVEKYIHQLIVLLQQHFKEKLLYVGLQGSYMRGEATESSDIDIMVVLDTLSVADLACYRSIIQSMDHFDKSCGFICGKNDLVNWNPLEICSLSMSTMDYYGCLADFIPSYDEQDIRNFIKLSLNNLYHELCHSYIHAAENKNTVNLFGAYKCVFFILQNWYYLKYKRFISTKAELLPLLDGKNHDVLKLSMDFKSGNKLDFDDCFDLLFTWCQDTLMTL